MLELIPADRMVSIEREVFPVLVGQGLICVQSTGYWRDIGTLESFLTANADAIAGRVHTRLGGAADAVLIDPSAQVDPTAVLTAPVQIGAGAVIGAVAAAPGGGSSSVAATEVTGAATAEGAPCSMSADWAGSATLPLPSY